MNTEPPFNEYHFIDLNGVKVDYLRELLGDRPEVTIHLGDCNEVLLNEVLPKVQYKDYKRGLCLLDPYGLHLNREVIRTVGESKAIDMFLKFLSLT